MIPLLLFWRRPVIAVKLKIWLDQTYNLPNKNRGQPFVQYVQYVGSDWPNSTVASYHTEKVPLDFGQSESIMPLF